MNFRGRWVLVTGASSGLGQAMAKLLAQRYGANILAVARRLSKLEALKTELAASGVELVPIAADLAQPADVARVLDEAKRVPLYAVILNAAVTHFGRHEELAARDFEAMVQTNVLSTVRLTSELLPYLEARDEGGGVLLVSSMAGLTPIPYQAAYSATKAFLTSFGQSLWHELRGKNVSLTIYAPGGIATEMTAGERFGKLRSWLMPVDTAARLGLAAFARREYLHVPGIINRVGSWLMKILPSKLVTAQMARTYRASLEAARP